MLKSVRTQIVVLAMLPVCGLVAVGCISLSRPYRVLADAGTLIPVVESVEAVGSAIHELQKERGLSSSALAANMAPEPVASLVAQRKTTDEVVKNLERALSTSDALNNGSELAKSADAVRGRVATIRETRTVVDQGTLQPLEAVDRYSATIEQLLQFQTVAAKVSPSQVVGDMLRTYRMLVAGKEYAGIERASGAAFLNRASADTIDLILYSKTMGARAVQDAYLKDLSLTMQAPEASVFTQEIRGDAIDAFMRARGIIEQLPTTRALQGVSGKLWFEQSTARINMLARVEKNFIAKAATLATDEIQRAKWAFIWGALALAASVFLVAGIAFWQALGISRRIAGLAKRMGLLAGGRTDIEILGIERRDEIGDMARAVEVFRDNAVALKAAESDAAESLQATEAERARNDGIRVRDAAAQALVVESVARGLEKLSSGDLTYRLDDAFAAEYEKLRADFNAAMDQLQETMRVVAGNTEGIRSGTGEISQAADGSLAPARSSRPPLSRRPRRRSTRSRRRCARPPRARTTPARSSRPPRRMRSAPAPWCATRSVR
jgi:methyl-accepting chemotaxis protein